MNEEAAPKEKSTVVRLKDKELVDQLCNRARHSILAWLRRRMRFVFWHEGDSVEFSYYDFGRLLGIARSEKLDLPSVAKVLAHHSPMKFRTFEATWICGDASYPKLEIQLAAQSEWPETLDEAWEGLERPPHSLSEPAGQLLKWVQLKRNQNEWIDRSTVGRQAQLRGTSWTADYLADRFKEIQEKANLGLKVERKEDEFRFSFEQLNIPATGNHRHGPLNPVLSLDFKQVKYAELDRFRETVYDWILQAELPADETSLAIWHVQDRKTLSKCFPAWGKDNWEISTFINFLCDVGLDHGLLWGYSFQDPQPWLYECCPKPGLTWAEVKESIRNARSMPPLTQRYGISAEAAALVKWFTTLRAKEWLGNLTPAIEDELETRIGISADKHDKNFGVYFYMLAEEISERTEWRVTVHPWSGGWGGPTHRLLVKRKPASFDDVVKQIQILAINQGKLLPRNEVESTLRTILGERQT